jgi:hypothetical protein
LTRVKLSVRSWNVEACCSFSKWDFQGHNLESGNFLLDEHRTFVKTCSSNNPTLLKACAPNNVRKWNDYCQDHLKLAGDLVLNENWKQVTCPSKSKKRNDYCHDHLKLTGYHFLNEYWKQVKTCAPNSKRRWKQLRRYRQS